MSQKKDYDDFEVVKGPEVIPKDYSYEWKFSIERFEPEFLGLAALPEPSEKSDPSKQSKEQELRVDIPTAASKGSPGQKSPESSIKADAGEKADYSDKDGAVFYNFTITMPGVAGGQPMKISRRFNHFKALREGLKTDFGDAEGTNIGSDLEEEKSRLRT